MKGPVDLDSIWDFDLGYMLITTRLFFFFFSFFSFFCGLAIARGTPFPSPTVNVANFPDSNHYSIQSFSGKIGKDTTCFYECDFNLFE